MSQSNPQIAYKLACYMIMLNRWQARVAPLMGQQHAAALADDLLVVLPPHARAVADHYLQEIFR